jgi:hypothetical protein
LDASFWRSGTFYIDSNGIIISCSFRYNVRELAIAFAVSYVGMGTQDMKYVEEMVEGRTVRCRKEKKSRIHDSSSLNLHEGTQVCTGSWRMVLNPWVSGTFPFHDGYVQPR